MTQNLYTVRDSSDYPPSPLKIWLEGTEAELERAKQFYESLQSQGMVTITQWSKLYPNRKSPGFRVYIELEILSDRPLEPKMAATSSGEE